MLVCIELKASYFSDASIYTRINLWSIIRDIDRIERNTIIIITELFFFLRIPDVLCVQIA